MRGQAGGVLVGFSGGLIFSMLAATNPATAAEACAAKAYVTNFTPSSVSVIDTAANTLLTNIPFPADDGAVNPTFTPDKKHLYVAHSHGDGVAVIDVATDKVVKTLTVGGGRPSGLAFSADGKRLAVSVLGQKEADFGAVRIVDMTTGKVSDSIPTDRQPERLAMTPDGKRIYAINLFSNSATVIDADSAKVIATIPVGRFPFNALMSPKGDRVYVSNVKSNTLTVIDTASNTVVNSIDTDIGPNGMAWSRDFKTIYVTDTYGDNLEAIDAETGKQTGMKGIGPKPGNIALSQDGKSAYVVTPFGTSVSVIDMATLKVAAKIDIGTRPSTIAICNPS